jgi:hypothetical protein
VDPFLLHDLSYKGFGKPIQLCRSKNFSVSAPGITRAGNLATVLIFNLLPTDLFSSLFDHVFHFFHFLFNLWSNFFLKNLFNLIGYLLRSRHVLGQRVKTRGSGSGSFSSPGSPLTRLRAILGKQFQHNEQWNAGKGDKRAQGCEVLVCSSVGVSAKPMCPKLADGHIKYPGQPYLFLA